MGYAVSGSFSRARLRMMSTPAPELTVLFSRWIKFPAVPPNFRSRLFSLPTCFWLWLWQIFFDSSCRAALSRFKAWSTVQPISSSTSGFCQARRRIPLEWLLFVSQRLTNSILADACSQWRWKGLSVKLVDGTSVRLADTESNQAAFPQPNGQKQGCGFPVMKVVALFSLATGVLLAHTEGTVNDHEQTLFKRLIPLCQAGDLLIGDRGYFAWIHYYLLGRSGVHLVLRKKKRLEAGLTTLKRHSNTDRLVRWTRNSVPGKGYTREQWNTLPGEIIVREITIQIAKTRNRTTKYKVLTTLLDPKEHPEEDFAELYLRRWRIELYFDQLKTEMGMSVLRCKSEDMVRKELELYFIAYNLVRAVQLEALESGEEEKGKDDELGDRINRISFKQTLDTVCIWGVRLLTCSRKTIVSKYMEMLRLIRTSVIPARPNRIEPRATKYRGTGYPLLTEPRHEYKEIPHRGKYRALT